MLKKKQKYYSIYNPKIQLSDCMDFSENQSIQIKTHKNDPCPKEISANWNCIRSKGFPLPL